MTLETPTIIVNLKTYKYGSTDRAAALAETCETVAHETGASIAVAVQNADVHRLSQAVDIPVYAQHLDPHRYGSNTGKDIAETLAYNGADGVLINHSEDTVPTDMIEEAVARAQNNTLDAIICIGDPADAEQVAAYGPDFIAYEPPELIGGDTSVSTAAPELVENAVNSSTVPVLCGAGIKDGDDVQAALDLGTRGVLIASGVVKADDPEAALYDLVDGIQR